MAGEQDRRGREIGTERFYKGGMESFALLSNEGRAFFGQFASFRVKVNLLSFLLHFDDGG